MSRPAIDVGIVVSSLSRARWFYETILGLEVIADVRTSIIGAGSMVMLRSGHSIVKLLEFDRPPPRDESPSIADRTGIRYLTFPVDNVDDVLDTVGIHRIPIVQPATDHPSGSRIAMINDPDGNIIELVTEIQGD